MRHVLRDSTKACGDPKNSSPGFYNLIEKPGFMRYIQQSKWASWQGWFCLSGDIWQPWRGPQATCRLRSENRLTTPQWQNRLHHYLVQNDSRDEDEKPSGKCLINNSDAELRFTQFSMCRAQSYARHYGQTRGNERDMSKTHLFSWGKLRQWGNHGWDVIQN